MTGDFDLVTPSRRLILSLAIQIHCRTFLNGDLHKEQVDLVLHIAHPGCKPPGRCIKREAVSLEGFVEMSAAQPVAQ